MRNGQKFTAVKKLIYGPWRIPRAVVKGVVRCENRQREWRGTISLRRGEKIQDIMMKMLGSVILVDGIGQAIVTKVGLKEKSQTMELVSSGFFQLPK